MAWIESHQELGRHPKTRKLARTLNISKPAAVGHLQYFWWWALDFAQDGDITKYDAEEIAEGALWEGDSDLFRDALVSTGFVDAPDDGTLHIHDWAEYAGKLIDRRKSDAERKRVARGSTGLPSPVQRTSSGHPADVRTPSGVTVPNRTVPYTDIDGERVSSSFAPHAPAIVVAADAADDTGSLDALALPLALPVASPLTPAPLARTNHTNHTNGHTPLQADVAPIPPAPSAPPSPSAPSSSPSSPSSPSRRKTAKLAKPEPTIRARDPIWDALVSVFGYEPETQAERGKWGKAVHDIKAAPSGTPEEVRRRAERHAALLASGELAWTLTPLALASHFGELGRAEMPLANGARLNGRHPPPRAAPPTLPEPVYPSPEEYSPWRKKPAPSVAQ